ncbi:MAG: sugar transferase [Chloroflexota bacterium]
MESLVTREPSLEVLETKQVEYTISPSMRRQQWILFHFVLLINDLGLMSLAVWLAFITRFELGIQVFQLEIIPDTPFYIRLQASLLSLTLFTFILNGLYNRKYLLGGIKEYSLIFRSVSFSMLCVIVVGFFAPALIFSRGWLAASWLLSVVLISGGRHLIRRGVYYLRGYGYFLSPTLIVGTNEESISLATQLSRWNTSGLDIVGFVDNQNGELGTEVYEHLRYLGNLELLEHLIEAFEIEELIIATSSLSRDEIVDIFKKYGLIDGLNLRLSSGLFEIVTTGIEVKEMAFAPLVQVRKARLTNLEKVVKRLLDYLILAMLAVPLAFIFLFLTIWIRMDSKGPAFYKRRVMGMNGKQFDALKFRTMHINGDEILEQHPELKAELEQNHKLKNDPRITRAGNILRKTSLDELPQLINVLMGQMSLVGPRMISPEETKMYQNWSTNLLTVLPGMTGLWQVSGRSNISYEDRVNLDMHYIRNWTIWLDVQILFQTIPAVLKQRGAY